MAVPITAAPLTGGTALRLVNHASRVRVRWDWVRVLEADVNPETGRLRQATAIVLLSACDGSGLAWRPDGAVLGRIRRPGSTTLVAYDPDDPSVWTPLRWWEDQPAPPSEPCGWSGGDVAGGLAQFESERARFLGGRREEATVLRVRSVPGTGVHDSIEFDIVFDIAGHRRPWTGRLAVVNDDLRRGDRILVALDGDGSIVGLDTDERYVSDSGRCLVWSGAARAAADPAPQPAAPAVPPVEEAPHDGHPPLTGAAASLRSMFARMPEPEAPPPAPASAWAGALALAKVRNDISAMSSLRTRATRTYETRVRSLLDGALQRGDIDVRSYTELLQEAGVSTG